MEDRIEKAHKLFEPYLPENTKLDIEETDGRLCAKYIMRLTYTSKKSGRKLNMIAKGENLPTKDDTALRFYVLQLVMTPAEIGRAFSRLYFLEKRARQDAFLQGLDGQRGNSVRVSVEDTEVDRLSYGEYA